MTMDWVTLLVLHRAECIDRLADNVEHAAKRAFTDRHRDWTASVDCFHAAHHTVGRRHRDRSHAAFAEVLLNFGNDVDRSRHIEPVRGDSQRLVDWWQVATLKLDVEHRADNLYDFTDLTGGTHVSI